MPSTGKAKLGNESLISQGQCLTWETFLCFMMKIFDVERSLYIFCTNCLNQGCPTFFNNGVNYKFEYIQPVTKLNVCEISSL